MESMYVIHDADQHHHAKDDEKYRKCLYIFIPLNQDIGYDREDCCDDADSNR